MNFSTHMIEGWKRDTQTLISKGMTADAYICLSVADIAETSPKFLLPQGGDVGLSSITPEQMKYARNPYPTTVFEYTAHPPKVLHEGATPSLRRVVTVMTPSAMLAVGDHAPVVKTYLEHFFAGAETLFSAPADNGLVMLCSYFADVSKFWVSPITAVYVPWSAFDHSGLAKPTARLLPLPLMTEALEAGAKLDGKSSQETCLMFAKESMEDITIVLKALLCLNARNVKEVIVPAPDALNKKRKKFGKTPFFEYRVLDIFLGENLRKVASGNNKRARAGVEAWMKCANKLHAVRGHFKTRKTGIFWWSDFIRGSNAEGVIVKDYNLIGEAK